MFTKTLSLAICCWCIIKATCVFCNVLPRDITRRDTSSQGCLIPEPLTHGAYRTHSSRCPSGDNSAACHLVPGVAVPELWVLYYSCGDGYQLAKQHRASLCQRGQWRPALPVCVPVLNLISRDGWGAQNRPEFVSHDLPIKRVIIEHTATPACFSQSDCVLRAQSIQEYHITQYGDIGYNFLVGGDGSILEGQGWAKRGAHTFNYNTGSIGVALIGNFVNTEAPEAMLTATRQLIEYGLASGKIAKDYKLNAHCQLIQVASPGRKVFDKIKRWPNWDSVNALRCTQ